MWKLTIRPKQKAYSKKIMERIVGLPCRNCELRFPDVEELMLHEGVHQFQGMTSFAINYSHPPGQGLSTKYAYSASSFVASGSFSH